MAGVDHTDRDHAVLSASGASRWMNCTPSARLEEKVSEKSSVYAKEGTIAHELSDVNLQREYKGLHGRTHNAEKRKLKTRLLKLLGSDDETQFTQMEREVLKYTDIVKEAFSAAQKRTPDATIELEQRLDYSYLVPEGFGTGDVVIIADGLMEIIDLKYGRGVTVYAKLNEQLMLYALGALEKFDLSYAIDRVKMTIVQPRLDHYDAWETSAKYLRNWGEKVVREKAVAAWNGEGEKVVGDWCKFCKVKAVCRAMAEHNLELAKHDFKTPDLMTVEELAPILKRGSMLQDWLAAIATYLYKELKEDRPVPGYKLVAGKSNRRWVNEPLAIETLKDLGHPKDKIVNEKIKGIGDIERLLGKDLFEKEMNKMVEKPLGEPTMVDAEDPRPAYGLASAKEDFS